MTYFIAIPSYKRSLQLQNKTLKCLKDNGILKEHINVFVIKEEEEEYKAILNPDYYNKIIVGDLGIVQQREFITNYYENGDNIISLDDDIESVDLSMTTYLTLDEFFNNAFQLCKDNGAYMWGVYPVFNPFYRQSRPSLSIGLLFIIGAFYGFINRKNEDDLRLELTREGGKEDVELSILYWLKDGKVLRFNTVGFKSKMYGVGGLGGLLERIPIMKKVTININNKYPLYTKIKIRKNGLYEIILNKNAIPIILTPPVIIPFDICQEDLSVLYALLEDTKTPVYTNKQGRALTFGKHKGMTLGYITARITKEFGLSRHTKMFPELYELLKKIGDKIVPFQWDGIQLNDNVVCPRHKDRGNVGNSVIFSIGEYEGGELIIEGFGEYDTNCNPLMFDGKNNYHYNNVIKSGHKYSFVFFKNIKQNIRINLKKN